MLAQVTAQRVLVSAGKAYRVRVTFRKKTGESRNQDRGCVQSPDGFRIPAAAIFTPCSSLSHAGLSVSPVRVFNPIAHSLSGPTPSPWCMERVPEPNNEHSSGKQRTARSRATHTESGDAGGAPPPPLVPRGRGERSLSCPALNMAPPLYNSTSMPPSPPSPPSPSAGATPTPASLSSKVVVGAPSALSPSSRLAAASEKRPVGAWLG